MIFNNLAQLTRCKGEVIFSSVTHKLYFFKKYFYVFGLAWWLGQ